MLSIGTHLCVCLLVVEIAIWKEVDGQNGNSQCSCYTFDESPKHRKKGREQCVTQGGDLVSMETEEEWEFIKTEIQNRTVYYSEWWIGLEKRKGEWTWMSNHALTYDKWQPGEPDDNNEKKFAIIAKEFNSTQGLLKSMTGVEDKGRICEYRRTNCGKDELRWCRSPHPALSNQTKLGTRGWNDTSLGPRYPSDCAVIKKQNTPVGIPILVALAGLVVIVAVNIFIIKCKNATRGSKSKQRVKYENHSEQVDIDLSEVTTIEVGTPSGLEVKVQPKVDCTGNSPRGADEGTNDILDIDASIDKPAKPEQPYYVNIPRSTRQGTLPDADTKGHYALVGDVNEKEEQKDSFVVAKTYSIDCNDDHIDGQTDGMNAANYATVSDTLGSRGHVTLGATESGYASVDVINENSQKGTSGQHGHDAATSAPQDGLAQYAVVDLQKKNSKKLKTKQDDNQNNPDEGYAPTEVIYANCQDVPLVQSQQNNIQHTLADSAPYAEYAVVNKSMKKKNRSVRKETIQPSEAAEVSYASVDVKCCQEAPQIQKQRGPRRKTDNGRVSTGTQQVEYAEVDISKKRSRTVKNAAHPSKPPEACYASVKVECGQDGAPMQRQRSSRRRKENRQQPPTENVPTAEVNVEYAVVDKAKKKNSSVKEIEPPSETVEASYATVDVIYDNY